jgi:hypothetical protein
MIIDLTYTHPYTLAPPLYPGTRDMDRGPLPLSLPSPSAPRRELGSRCCESCALDSY